MNHTDPASILFLDIETVPLTEHFSGLSARMQHFWLDKAQKRYKLEDAAAAAAHYEGGAIHAEFGRVLCVSLGMLVVPDKGQAMLRVVSIMDDDELVVLSKLAKLMEQVAGRTDDYRTGVRQVRYLCAHNGKEFDFPFLARRMLVQGIALPGLLQVQGKKPWDLPFVDTMELWKFGDYKAYTSLDLLAELFGLPSPKSDISGADVARVYYKDKAPDRIKHYCEQDVVTLVRVYQKLLQMPVLPADAVVFA
jgi:3'-5' exonuclease